MAWFKGFFARKWVRLLLMHVGTIACLLMAYTLITLLLGNACPFYAITGICCPFCGMTRAHAALFSLDFKTAFYYHPMFFYGAPFLWILAHESLFKKPWAVWFWRIAVGVGVVGLIAIYVVRMITSGPDFFA